MTASVRRISESTFFVAVNGAGPSPPASGLIDYLVKHGARRLTTVFHPLEPEHEPQHVITVYEPSAESRVRRVRMPSRPPLTYAFDPFIPLWPDSVDAWFGFNNLAAARGLLARRAGRAEKVVYWAVDFVPNRFGQGLLTRAYDAFDAFCCRHADARFELSEPALRGRDERLGLQSPDAAPARVVPIGAWLDGLPITSEDGFAARRVVYVGHLVKRQGVGLLMEALELLAGRGVEFSAEIAGSGPLEGELREHATRTGLDGSVRFPGFIPEQRDVESFLASGSVAIAPYDPRDNVLTQHADPSKLKAYLAAGLPIVMTDLPHNAQELAQHGGAELVPFEAEALADAIERSLDSPDDWRRRRAAALDYARSFDWEKILRSPLEELGFAT